MQPEQERFLGGVRREILKAVPHLDAKSPDVSSRRLALHRAAIILTRLELRAKRLPDFLDSIRETQLALLESTFADFGELGLALPANALRDRDFALTLGGGEDSIRAYELFAASLSACLEALSSGVKQSAATGSLAARLTNAMIDLERRVRAFVGNASQDIDRGDADAIALPAHSVPTPTDAEFTAYLRRRMPQYPDIRAENLRVLKVFSSNEINTLDLSGHPDWPAHAILRRGRGFSSAKTSVAPEFDVLRILYDAGVAVPRPLLADSTGSEFQHPFILLERLSGNQCSVGELGGNARDIMTDFAKVLAKFHRVDAARLIGREALEHGPSLRERVLKTIDKYRQVWMDERLEPSLTLEAAYAWLPRHIEDIECSDGTTLWSIVHGDCDFRNMLVDGNRVSGMLDWELAHVGHPAEDLGYCRPDVEAVMPWEEFVATYRAAGGPVVDERAIRYFQVWNTAFRVTAGLTATVAYCAGLHADITMAGAGFIDCQYWLGVMGDCIQHADEMRNQSV